MLWRRRLTDKKAKKEVDYEPRASGFDYCRDCAKYLGRSVMNNCKGVKGHVNPRGWCKLFIKARD
jgi:hypothetical protein